MDINIDIVADYPTFFKSFIGLCSRHIFDVIIAQKTAIINVFLMVLFSPSSLFAPQDAN